MNKKLLFMCLGILLLIGVIVFFLIFRTSSTPSSLFPSPSQPAQGTEPIGNGVIPTRVPLTLSPHDTPIVPVATITAVLTPQTNPPVLENQSDNTRLLEKINHRPPLANTDLQTKAKIIRITNQEGVLHQGANFRVDYVSAADLFQVEIQSIDYVTAKQDAVQWLKTQGFSLDGICNLPVMFYLNFSTANDLRGKNVLFSPLAEGC